jgi:Methyltransferase domain
MEPSTIPLQVTSNGACIEDGIHFKRFEKVVAGLLLHISFQYVKIPCWLSPIPQQQPQLRDDVKCNDTTASLSFTELWDTLPPAARVWGNLPGQMTHESRAQRKENQIRSILRCIIPFLLPTTDQQSIQQPPFTIVDFGGGTGHLAIPLALLFPHIRIICVDLGRHSLNLLHQKAAKCCHSGSDSPESGNRDAYPLHEDMGLKLQVTSIPNLYTYYGPVHTFVDHPFDMAVALHLCGEATDVVLQLAGETYTKAVIVAPCCVGKLSASSHNPYVYQATGSNCPTIQYPRSSKYRSLINHADDWNALAEAADYGDTNLDDNNETTVDIRNNQCAEKYGSRNSLRKIAKTLLEKDRCLHLEEMYGYTTILTQMEPSDASPKHDIVVAWLPHEYTDRDLALYWTDECSVNHVVTMRVYVLQKIGPNLKKNRFVDNSKTLFPITVAVMMIFLRQYQTPVICSRLVWGVVDVN